MSTLMQPHECEICHAIQLAIHGSGGPFRCMRCAMWLSYIEDIREAELEVLEVKKRLTVFLSINH